MTGEGVTAEPVELASLAPADAAEARALILAGLAEHWGSLDPALNRDLDDIPVSYAHGVFLVARLRGQIVGTGALVPAGAGTGQVVRMSVAAALRRRGLGKQILAALLAHAGALGYRRVVLETTATWSEVIAFYMRCGFQITHYQDGDVYLARDLE